MNLQTKTKSVCICGHTNDAHHYHSYMHGETMQLSQWKCGLCPCGDLRPVKYIFEEEKA